MRTLSYILGAGCVVLALLIVLVLIDRARLFQSPRSAADVIAAFRAAGLEADSRPLTRDDYGIAPLLCLDGSQRLLIASLGDNSGGQVFQCPSAAEATKLKTFYDESGKVSALFFSYTYQRDTTLVRINGSLPEDQARRYNDALMAMP